MKTFDFKSFLNGIREQAQEMGLTDPERSPAPRSCGDCGILKAAIWNDKSEMWGFPSCDQILVCQMRKQDERHSKNYEAAVQCARIPIPMRGLSLVDRPGREVLKPDRRNRRLANACLEWDGSTWIVATGSVGSGKTSWLTALLLEALWKNPKLNTRWTSEQRLYRKAMLHGDKSSGGRDRVLQEFMDAEILMLDDLGASRRNMTEWQGGAMRDLLIERHLTGVPTLITTNLDLDQVATRYGDHVASRLGELSGGVIQIGGKDRRSGRSRAGRD